MSPRPQETGRKLRDERRGEESGCRGATSNDSHEAEVQGWEWYILPDRIARYCQILPVQVCLEQNCMNCQILPDLEG